MDALTGQQEGGTPGPLPPPSVGGHADGHVGTPRQRQPHLLGQPHIQLRLGGDMGGVGGEMGGAMGEKWGGWGVIGGKIG